MSQRVVCAAVRAADGELLLGIRHYSPDMLKQIEQRADGEKFKHRLDEDQGFVDQHGRWMSRKEAYAVASETIHWLGVRAEIPRVTLSLTPGQPASDQVLLRMRPAGDFTPDEELKRSWLHAMPADDRRRLVAVFDDRDKVVEMWRKEGLTCFQVAPGGF